MQKTVNTEKRWIVSARGAHWWAVFFSNCQFFLILFLLYCNIDYQLNILYNEIDEEYMLYISTVVQLHLVSLCKFINLKV